MNAISTTQIEGAEGMPFQGNSRARLAIVLAAIVLGSATVTAVTLRGRQELTVDKPSENLRDAPDGEKIGTLVRGATVEKISQDGKWVQFRLEGWIWGPSLEGFEEERLEADEEGDGKGSASLERRNPRPALREREQLARIRELFDDEFGAFYSVSHDKVRKQLIVRFRVDDVGDTESLELRQMQVQAAALTVLEGELEFDSIRVESNRFDGGGKVGVVVVVTDLEHVQHRDEEADPATWRKHTRFSLDGGKTWTEE